MNTLRVDLLIFGAGIAGLWTLLRARQQGYRVLLLENRALGGVQTLASQGIIHGGAKYALGGQMSAAARAIGAMPGIWRSCLEGRGELDLSDVRILSPFQYLWSSGSLGSSLAGFFAGKLMRSRVSSVAQEAFPPPFDDPAFQGQLYRLDEPVLDVPSLVQSLARQGGANCARYDWRELATEAREIRIGAQRIQPRRILFAAGQGNAALLRHWAMSTPKMQLRPLHMVMLKGQLPQVYAHCLGASANPRLTITSYPLADGQTLWYLGGQLAESGVSRTEAEQIRVARRELNVLLPWLEPGALQWAGLRIERAEVATRGGARPQDSFLSAHGRVWTAWPTKLAFAPRLAQQVLHALQQAGIEPRGADVPALAPPALAHPPWEQVKWN